MRFHLSLIFYIVLLLNLLSNSSFSQSKSTIPSLIPQPKQIYINNGIFDKTEIINYNILKSVGLDASLIKKTLGNTLPLSDKPNLQPPRKGLLLVIGEPAAKEKSSEAYQLSINREQIIITAKTKSGILMGLRTLAQLAMDDPIPQCEITDWPDMSFRATHLCYHLIREDLAYNCPNFSGLMQQVDRLASVKQNAVLLELESMFPYKKHPTISCKIAFSDSQIITLKEKLESQQIEIIPLVQCLGHAYNVLVHDKYAPYRELPEYIQQYCPTNESVIDLYMEFVDEYLRLFPDLKYWHMGGDESRMLGRCNRCARKIDKYGISRLYIDHVSEIAIRLYDRGIVPMIWSDMLEHYPEALEDLPTYIIIIYWNYDLPTWPRPYVAKLFMDKGFRVIGANGVRFGAAGTELSVYYHAALRGIETLTKRLHKDDCREIITTNWMKGSPHESTDYGLLYAADLAWDVESTRYEFKRRYAQQTFGLADPSICDLFESLSLWLPYAEPVSKHMPDRLNRLDLSGFRFKDKWNQYTQTDREKQTIHDLQNGVVAAENARDLLNDLGPQCTRGRKQLDILQLSSDCIKAKANLALALHQSKRFINNKRNLNEVLKWNAQIPAILSDWYLTKERHRLLLTQSGFPPAVKFLNHLMFEPEEAHFLEKTRDDLIRNRIPDVSPDDLTIPFLDNPGPPYQRGYFHGSVFRKEIKNSIQHWCYGYQPEPSDWYLQVKDRMYHYVSDKFPKLIEEMRGIADGAGVSLDEIFWLNSFNAIGRIPHKSQCSTIFLRGENDRVILGKTSDIDPLQRKEMVLRRIRYKEADFYVIGWIGTIWVETALTKSGLAFGCNSAAAQPNQSGYGIPQHFAAYPMLFEAASVEEAIEFFKNTDFAGKGLIMGLADANGESVIIEKTGTTQGVRWIDEEAELAVNLYECENLMNFNATMSKQYTQNSLDRKAHFTQWKAKIKFDDTVGSLKKLLTKTRAKGSFCQTGQAGLYTEAAVILSPAQNQLQVTGFSPSRGLYVTYTFDKE